MNGAKLALVILIVGIVVVPVFFKIVQKICQDIDFKRQIEGKIPEREYKGNNPSGAVSQAMAQGGSDSQQMYKESCDVELRMRGVQNIIGPK